MYLAQDKQKKCLAEARTLCLNQKTALEKELQKQCAEMYELSSIIATPNNNDE